MFRITCFVDDKNLGEAFKRLAGIGRNVEHQYVPNVEGAANGKVHIAAADSRELFIKEMHRRKLTSVNAKTAREIIVAMGFATGSYSYMLQGLVKAGVMKKSGTPQKLIYTLKGEK